MKHTEIKSLTGQGTLRAAIAVFADRVRARLERSGRGWRLAGTDWEAGYVLFVRTASIDGGATCEHYRAPFEDVADSLTLSLLPQPLKVALAESKP